MYIVHDCSTVGDARAILSDGILPSRITGNQIYKMISDPAKIYLSLRPFDKDNEEAVYNFGWGKFSFVLDDSWVKAHAGQFLENTDSWVLDFQAGLDYYGITRRMATPEAANDRSHLGLVSDQPIPLEALERLVLADEKYASRILDSMPQHMGLYVWDRHERRLITAKEPQKVY